MNKLFTMARQTGRAMMARMAAMIAMGLDAYPLHAPTSVSVQQWPVPDHRNSTAADDKRCARRRRNIAKRRGVSMAGQDKEKPHIRLIQGAQPPVWVCKGQDRWNGYGESPRAAYRDWRQEKGGRRIDLGRYAGTYGGYLPDKQVSTYAYWWYSICDYGKQIAIGFIIAGAATLWVASWMFGR